MSKIIGIAALARSGKDTVASMLLKHEGVTTYALADPLKVGCQVLFGLTEEETWNDKLKESEIPLWGWSPRKFFQTVGTEWLRELNPDHWLLRADLALNRKISDDADSSKCNLNDPKAPFKLAVQAIFGLSNEEIWNSKLLNNVNTFWKITPKQMVDFLQEHTYAAFNNYDELRSNREISLPVRTIPKHEKNDIVIIKDVRFENEAEFLRSHNGVIWHVKRDNALKVISHSSEKGIEVKTGDLIIDNNASLKELELVVEKNWEEFMKFNGRHKTR